MKFNLLHVFTLLSLGFVGSHALTPREYWNSVLPNTRMPQAIKDLLFTQAWDDGMKRVTTNTASKYIKLKHQLEPSYPFVASNGEVNDHPQSTLLPFYIYGKSSDEVNDHPQSISFTQPGLSNIAAPAYLFFLENDLRQGKEREMKLHKEGQKTMFLPKDISDSIPFLSKDLPAIYNMFSIKPDSMEAETMKLTLFLCNQYKGIEGEEKFCATSLESMIDLATTKLGKKVKALSAENAKDSTIPQKYKIELIKKVATDKAMVCHPQMYPYAVFNCHMIKGTQTYVVSLEGVNGTKVKAVAVCHADTSKWNPKHPAFQFFKVNPGSPICHFLFDDTVVWVPY